MQVVIEILILEFEIARIRKDTGVNFRLRYETEIANSFINASAARDFAGGTLVDRAHRDRNRGAVTQRRRTIVLDGVGETIRSAIPVYRRVDDGVVARIRRSAMIIDDCRSVRRLGYQ